MFCDASEHSSEKSASENCRGRSWGRSHYSSTADIDSNGDGDDFPGLALKTKPSSRLSPGVRALRKANRIFCNSSGNSSKENDGGSVSSIPCFSLFHLLSHFLSHFLLQTSGVLIKSQRPEHRSSFFSFHSEMTDDGFDLTLSLLGVLGAGEPSLYFLFSSSLMGYYGQKARYLQDRILSKVRPRHSTLGRASRSKLPFSY